jgi:sulfate transport system ATP-binding protein
MKPATPFVARFVGESNRLPVATGGEIHVRPHDLEIVADASDGRGEAVLVDNVFRKGGVWRIEGTLGTEGGQSSDQVIELDLDAAAAPPPLGQTIRVAPRRATTFPSNGA